MTHLQKAFQLDPLPGPNCSTWANSCPSAAICRTAALRSSSQALVSSGGRGALGSSGCSSAHAQCLLYASVKGQPHGPTFLSLALAKAFVLRSELIQPKRWRRKNDWLLVNWIGPDGAAPAWRGQTEAEAGGWERARFSLPAAAARANTDCNGCWITGSVFGNTVLGRFKHLLLAVPEVHQRQCAD